MSHVCSLFSRRAYNLEAIACVPIGSGTTSKIWLQVDELERLEQVIKQIRKLPMCSRCFGMTGSTRCLPVSTIMFRVFRLQILPQSVHFNITPAVEEAAGVVVADVLSP